MKRYLSSFVAAALLCGFNLNAQWEAEPNPSYFDFSNFMASHTEGTFGFAFTVLPIMIFFCTFSAMLYYLRIMVACYLTAIIAANLIP